MRLFTSILYSGLFASALIIIVILIRKIADKQCNRVICLLWGLVAIRLLCPSSFGSLINVPNITPYEAEPAFVSEGSSMSEEVVFEKDNLKNDDFGETAVIGNPSERTKTVSGAKTIESTVWKISFVVWIVGAVLLSGYFLVSAILLRRKLRVCIEEQGVFLSDRILVPFVFGLFKAGIYVPYGISEVCKADVVAHERVHVQRKDNLWKALYLILAVVYWFFPLVWVSFLLFSRDLEMACDDEVTKGMSQEAKERYVVSLLSCGSTFGGEKKMFFSSFSSGQLKERTKNIMNKKESTVTKKVVIVTCGILVTATSLLFGVKLKSSAKNVENLSTDVKDKIESSESPAKDMNPNPRYYDEREYYNHSTENGLTVFIWEYGRDVFLCGLVEGDLSMQTSEGLFDMVLRQGVSVEKMREILATYDLPEERIDVRGAVDPTSSFAGSHHDMSQEEYAEFLRKMIFPD
ncbi:MAG: M56 family metallopeptidase [Lachnospiraceae bacterium]|nr:M56 family metallopeptidase [Lachnospiraceae bacterium]